MQRVVGLAMLLVGCGPTHHLGYDTAAIPAQPGPSLNAVVSVEPFEDTRRQNEPAIVFTSKDFPVVVKGTTYCLTLEQGYGGKVTDDLRSVIERHVRQRAVIAAWNGDAEKYRLDGTLAALLGQVVDPSSGGVFLVPIGFGPLVTGAAMAVTTASIANGALAKQNGQIDIVFQNLRLTRLRDGASRSLPDIAVHFKGNVPGAGAECHMAFEQLDRHLKPAVEQLSAAVEQSIRDWPSNEP